MGPGVRVLMHPLCHHTLYFIQCVKDFRIQPFMSKRPIEAFVAAVLPGTARMDTDRLDMDYRVSYLCWTYPCALNNPGLPSKCSCPTQGPPQSFLPAGSPKILHNLKPHVVVQLAPPVITLVTDPRTVAGLLCPHVLTDPDLDGSQ